MLEPTLKQHKIEMSVREALFKLRSSLLPDDIRGDPLTIWVCEEGLEAKVRAIASTKGLPFSDQLREAFEYVFHHLLLFYRQSLMHIGRQWKVSELARQNVHSASDPKLLAASVKHTREKLRSEVGDEFDQRTLALVPDALQQILNYGKRHHDAQIAQSKGWWRQWREEVTWFSHTHVDCLQSFEAGNKEALFRDLGLLFVRASKPSPLQESLGKVGVYFRPEPFGGQYASLASFVLVGMQQSTRSSPPVSQEPDLRQREGASGTSAGKTITEPRRPMNVYVRRGSRAEKHFRKRAGSPSPKAIAPGIPPTPVHDLKFQGGKTIQDLRFVNFYVGGDAWDAGDIANIDKALSAAMSDQDLNNVMVQYFPGPITTTFDGSQTLPGSPPAVMSQGDVEQLVATFFSGGKLTGHDLTTTLFNFMLPPGTVLNTDTATTGGGQHVASGVKRQAAAVKSQAVVPKALVPKDEADSLNGLGGYHGSVHVSGIDIVYYAVGVYSQTEADGTVNGIPVFDQPWKNVVATFYHELNEARTDADVEDAILAGNSPNANSFLGWVSDQGEEIGDFPVSEAGGNLTEVFQEVELTDNSGTVPVQFMYSDAVHGPEGPIAQAHAPVNSLQQKSA